ncbi:MAG: hypothetical protein ACOY3X_03870 [Pseudomonadota bacterium]
MSHSIAMSDRNSRFLRQVLLADAASSIGMGVLLTAGAGLLAAPLGLSQTLLLVAGLALFPCAALMVAAARTQNRALTGLIVAGNVAWVLASIAVLELWPGITTAGMAFVAAQAVAVTVLAALEWRGLKLLRHAAVA